VGLWESGARLPHQRDLDHLGGKKYIRERADHTQPGFPFATNDPFKLWEAGTSGRLDHFRNFDGSVFAVPRTALDSYLL
jgi:hypothetical protein